jgi:peroxiredoxin
MKLEKNNPAPDFKLKNQDGKIEECWYKVSPKDTVPKVLKFLKS